MTATEHIAEKRNDNENKLVAFFNLHGLLAKNLKDWRMVPPDKQRHGYINGLSQYHGTLHATDGILCAIVDDTGTVYIGHVDWFLPDAKNRVIAIAKKRQTEADKLLATLGY